MKKVNIIIAMLCMAFSLSSVNSVKATGGVQETYIYVYVKVANYTGCGTSTPLFRSEIEYVNNSLVEDYFYGSHLMSTVIPVKTNVDGEIEVDYIEVDASSCSLKPNPQKVTFEQGQTGHVYLTFTWTRDNVSLEEAESALTEGD